MSRYLPVRLDNATCPYCGTVLNGTATIEHVIGRRFIPKGKLNCDWNLILRSCKPCNNRKAALEDDLSAITMQPDARGDYHQPDDMLIAEALRKGQRSISRRTGKPVSQSQEEMTINVPFAQGVEMTFNLLSPPQADSERIYELAQLQLMALFYWITYTPTTKKGGFWLGDFAPVLEAPRSNWGNSVHLAFMQSVLAWEPRLRVITADGFFKAVIRRHPEAVCWSWAVEWNHNLRVVGFFGEREPLLTAVQTLPRLKINTLFEGPDQALHYHIETRLSGKDDQMFR